MQRYEPPQLPFDPDVMSKRPDVCEYGYEPAVTDDVPQRLIYQAAKESREKIRSQRVFAVRRLDCISPPS